MKTRLYRQNDYWEIWHEDNTIFMYSSKTKQTYTEVVLEGKASRTLAQQIELQMQARIKRKLDNGYKHTQEEASEATNQLDLPLPMLANKFKPVNWREIWVQPKLDGMRLLVAMEQSTGELIAYTRRGQRLETVDHILWPLVPWFEMNPSLILDGELYRHGTPLQDIMSLAKRQQAGTETLEYRLFDLADPALPYSARLHTLNMLNGEHAPEGVKLVPSQLVPNVGAAQAMLQEALSDGYEGLILRNGAGLYRNGKRSSDLLKLKHFHDEEFKCVGAEITPAGVPVLICVTAAGKPFRATAPGNHIEREGAERFVGHHVTVKFAGLTKEGVPFHPIALG